MRGGAAQAAFRGDGRAATQTAAHLGAAEDVVVGVLPGELVGRARGAVRRGALGLLGPARVTSQNVGPRDG